jgi:type IX secretion system PorP/SprF family membrane protein
MKRNTIARLTLAATLALSAPVSYAQDIHWTQFDMTPLVLNPAFTGMFDGTVRASGIYRTQWGSVTVPYVTFGGSVDMPLLTENNGDYLAAGLQIYNDKAGDGNLQNFTGMLSVAYHKALGTDEYNSGDLAVGLQGGYAQKAIDLTKLYFGDEFNGGSFVPGSSQEYLLGMGNSVNYYLVAAGLSYSKKANENLSYVIGISANNINQPNEAIQKKQTSETNLDMRFCGTLGINWIAGERLAIKPAVLFQYQAGAQEIIAGSEFNYQVGNSTGYQDFSTAVFLGGWYRNGDAAMITGGVDFKGFRIGLGYDYNISSLNPASNGKGGFEIAVRYIAPNAMKFAGKRVVPCTRF